jgi:predicted permease
MSVAFFISLLTKIVPLYLNIGLGFLAGKSLHTNKDTIARFVFFIINPMIIFNGVLYVELEPSVLSLPLVTYCISCVLCVLFYRLSKNIWEDSSKNLVAYSAGTGNSGYFGLPVALLLFSNEGEGIYILLLLGVTLYENTLGYYLLAKGSLPAKECFKKVFQLPSLYAFLVALSLNYFKVPVPGIFVDFMVHIKGAYIVLGMMIIGLSLAELPHFKLDKKFIGMTFLAKFFAWPLAVLALNYMDSWFFGFYTHDIHNALMLISIVPIAVNTVIVASLLDSKPEKASAAILLSTFFALFYVPVMVAIFINGNQ